jgi:YHS domain-containing protein
MSTPQRVETKCLEERRRLFHGRRNIDRRSFMKAAAFGTTVGIVAAHWFPPEVVAFASEARTNKEKRKKDSLSKSLAAARCPVTGDSVSKDVSIDYRLGKLYFCSAECIDKFRADRAQYEAKANAQLVITGQFKQIQCPLTRDEFSPGIKVRICGVDVCFCCADCAKKVRRVSADKRAELVFGKCFDKGFASTLAKTAGSPQSAADSAGKKWQCVVCGYVHTGTAPPASCPKCGAKSDSFTPASS